MTTVAFVGLGVMGAPMARNLVRAGFEVVGHDHSQSKIDVLVAAGGKGATNLADTVADADVIVTMVADSPDVDRLMTGSGEEQGIFAWLEAVACWSTSPRSGPTSAPGWPTRRPRPGCG